MDTLGTKVQYDLFAQADEVSYKEGCENSNATRGFFKLAQLILRIILHSHEPLGLFHR